MNWVNNNNLLLWIWVGALFSVHFHFKFIVARGAFFSRCKFLTFNIFSLRKFVVDARRAVVTGTRRARRACSICLNMLRNTHTPNTREKTIRLALFGLLTHIFCCCCCCGRCRRRHRHRCSCSSRIHYLHNQHESTAFPFHSIIILYQWLGYFRTYSNW